MTEQHQTIQEQPLVSVILCSYNGADFIEAQLNSLREQNYPFIEFICSDNNSTDGTGLILQKWCDEKPGRTFIHYPEKGLNKNFFHAIPMTTGKYIMFCDQDDVWLPHKVARLVDFAEQNPHTSLVYGLSRQFTGDPPAMPVTTGSINYLEGNNIQQTLLISFTLGHNLLIPKDVLQQIPVPANETIAYDWWITVSAMCIGPIRCLPEVLTYWRQHTNNTTTKINDGLFYKTRISYLQQFLNNPLITGADRNWIHAAANRFRHLNNKRWSFSLFLFLLTNAPTIFFYKTKKNTIGKWISFLKWSIRMSRKNYRP